MYARGFVMNAKLAVVFLGSLFIQISHGVEDRSLVLQQPGVSAKQTLFAGQIFISQSAPTTSCPSQASRCVVGATLPLSVFCACLYGLGAGSCRGCLTISSSYCSEDCKGLVGYCDACGFCIPCSLVGAIVGAAEGGSNMAQKPVGYACNQPTRPVKWTRGLQELLDIKDSKKLDCCAFWFCENTDDSENDKNTH